MPGSWSDFLKLRSGPAPPPSSEAGAVRVYADASGALRSVQSDGTDAAIGGGGGSQPSYASVVLATPVAIPSAVVPFDTVKIDADGYWDPVNHTFTVPAGKGGLFLAGAALLFDSTTTETGGTGQLANDGPDPNATFPMVEVDAGIWFGAGSGLLRLGDGDSVELDAATYSPGAGELSAGCYFWLSRLGASS